MYTLFSSHLCQHAALSKHALPVVHPTVRYYLAANFPVFSQLFNLVRDTYNQRINHCLSLTVLMKFCNRIAHILHRGNPKLRSGERVLSSGRCCLCGKSVNVINVREGLQHTVTCSQRYEIPYFTCLNKVDGHFETEQFNNRSNGEHIFWSEQLTFM